MTADEYKQIKQQFSEMYVLGRPRCYLPGADPMDPATPFVKVIGVGNHFPGIGDYSSFGLDPQDHGIVALWAPESEIPEQPAAAVGIPSVDHLPAKFMGLKVHYIRRSVPIVTT